MSTKNLISSQPDTSAGATIKSIKKGSIAARTGLRVGDCLVKIGGHPIEDLLDLQFYFDGEQANLEVLRLNEVFELWLQTEPGKSPGWTFEPLTVRHCRCNCAFCFVSQLPAGLRPPLYIKDEDYRFSFLFGNYITLIGLKPHDLKRIFRLRLSPLYVSIHAVDPIVRGRLLGFKSAPILPQLQELISGGILIHGQIVLVPGINDGEALRDSLQQLAALYPGLSSLSIVPVGLTQFRMGLHELRLLQREDAEKALTLIDRFQEKMLREKGSRWVFPADELLLLAECDFPKEGEYEDYPQIENGVGLVRWTLDSAYAALKEIPRELTASRKILWVTGRSAELVLKSLAQDIVKQIKNLTIEVLPVTNHLLGETVTVAGLLGGKDVHAALEAFFKGRASNEIDVVYLPPDCVNNDGIMLDDWTPQKLTEVQQLPVIVFDGDWKAMLTGIKKGRR